MKQFIVFFHANLAGQLSPAMGSEGVLPLDGRLNRASAYLQAQKQAHSLRHVKPGLLGFQLRRGDFRSSSPASPVMPLSRDVLDAFDACREKGIVEW
jgi:hypothetical protein